MKKNLYTYLLASTLLIAPTASFGLSWFTKTITEAYDHPWTKKFLTVATIGSLGYIWYQQRQHRNDLVNQKSKYAQEVQDLDYTHEQKLRAANELIAEKDAEISRHRGAQTDLDARNREIWKLKSDACTTGYTLDQQAAEINRLEYKLSSEQRRHTSSHESLVLATLNAYNTIEVQKAEISSLKESLDKTISLAKNEQEAVRTSNQLCKEMSTYNNTLKADNEDLRAANNKITQEVLGENEKLREENNTLKSLNGILQHSANQSRIQASAEHETLEKENERMTALAREKRILVAMMEQQPRTFSFMKATAGPLLATSPAATVSLSLSSESTPIATQSLLLGHMLSTVNSAATLSDQYLSERNLSSSNPHIAETVNKSDQNMKIADELLEMLEKTRNRCSKLTKDVREHNSQSARGLAQILSLPPTGFKGF